MRIKTTILLICLICIQSSSLFGRDYWGLRNIESRMPDSVYVGFDADYYAYPLSWTRTEMQDDEFTWNTLDNSLDFAEQFGGTVVLVVSCNSSWACDGEERAPNDLDRRTPLANDPPENGYSESLYDFAYQLVNHIAERENPVVKYLRFVNEPEYNWVIGRDWEQDVEDYVRCLRTFYIGAHNAADENEIEISVSHGGFYLVGSLARKYYRIGEEDEALQDSLLTLLQSRFERHATRIRSWDDVAGLVEGRGGIPPTYWSDVMAGQTEWLDWFDIHYHWKPRFIFDELTSFEEVVQDSSGEVRPWLAAEAAMQLAQGSLTEYDERFHAADMARKWILGMAFGLEGICTPMTGYPPEHFFGLYNDQQEEYLSATTYRFLRSIIQPLHEPEDRSDQQFRYYLFNEESSDVQVIWQDILFDSREGIPYDLFVECTEEYRLVTVYNILGEILAQVEQGNDSLLTDINNAEEPLIIVSERSEKVDNGYIRITPDGFDIISVYPNPFNSRTTITYELGTPSPTRVAVYDLYGRQVNELFKGVAGEGVNQLTWNAAEHPSGIYLLWMTSPYGNAGLKVVLVR